MIAAIPAPQAISRRAQLRWPQRCIVRFHSVYMTNFLLDLISNLTLMVIVLGACRVCNRLIADASLNGLHVFIALMLLALVFDAALTFLVLADARTRYGQFSQPVAFFERAVAYLAAIGIALIWRRAARRRRAVRKSHEEPVVIHTSPYSESHLRM